MADRKCSTWSRWAEDAVTRPAESSEIAKQKEQAAAETSRGQAIADRASQMPKASVRTYLKATRGKASPRIAIKAFCMECVGWSRAEVTNCTGFACPLWMYRPFQREGRKNG